MDKSRLLTWTQVATSARAALLAAPTFVCFTFGGGESVALLNAAIHSDKMRQPVSHPYSYFPKMFPPKLNFVPTVTR